MNKENLIFLSNHRLKALFLTAAKSDVRKYLKGVCFKAINGKVWGIATDGNRIGRLLVAENWQGQDFEWIIGRKAVKQALDWKGDIYLEADSGRLLVGGMAITDILDGTTIEGYSFPQKALKTINDHITTITDDTANLKIQAKFIKDLAKIAKLLAMGSEVIPAFIPTLHHLVRQNYGGNVFTIVGVPDYVHIIMSLREWDRKEQKEQIEKALKSATILAELPIKDKTNETR